MAREGRSIRPLISLLLVVATVLGLLNVYSDNGAVQAQASRLACGGTDCPATVIGLSRTPIAQTFTFNARPPGKGARSVEISCQKAFILLGDYGCKVSSP